MVDATFGQSTNRALFTEALIRQDVPYYFLEAQASETTIRQRLKQRDQQLYVVSDARLADFDRLNQAYQAPTEIPEHHFRAISTETSLDESLSVSLNQLWTASKDARSLYSGKSIARHPSADTGMKPNSCRPSESSPNVSTGISESTELDT